MQADYAIAVHKTSNVRSIPGALDPSEPEHPKSPRAAKPEL